MISKNAATHHYWMIRFACHTGMIPYTWNPETPSLLGSPTFSWYYFHCFYIMGMGSFSCFRLLQWYLDIDENSARQPILETMLNIIWAGGYCWISILLVQFQFFREEIRIFYNSILEEIEQSSSSSPSSPWASRFISMATFLVIMGPGTHALTVLSVPCSPQFFSSLILNCSDRAKAKETLTLLRASPFLIREFYGVTIMMLVSTYNWALVYLGLQWILREIKRAAVSPFSYRRSQLITTLLNHSAIIFLLFFPSMLFFVLGLFIFGCIRLWRLEPRVMFMFPVCAALCGFQCLTPLYSAGNGNKMSMEVVNGWLKNNKVKKKGKEVRKFARSCPPIKVRAGFLYTFDNSILPISLNNLSLLVFNLLNLFDI